MERDTGPYRNQSKKSLFLYASIGLLIVLTAFLFYTLRTSKDTSISQKNDLPRIDKKEPLGINEPEVTKDPEESESVFDNEALEVIQEIQEEIQDKNQENIPKSIPSNPEDIEHLRQEKESIQSDNSVFEDMESRKAKSLDEFEAALIHYFKRAKELEIQWFRMASSCYAGWLKERGQEKLERDWYIVWNLGEVRDPDPHCLTLMSDIKRIANEIRSGLTIAIDKARHDGLYPGEIRELRKKYRFSWRGFD